MTPGFAVGQRWVSNTESELGLGLVEDNDGRRVTVFFPAAEEHRIYAVDNAPLSRVEYSPGEQVTTVGGENVLIDERMEHAGCYIYNGTDEHGTERQFVEADLVSAVQFSKPQDRLLAGQIDPLSAFDLRADTIRLRQRHRCSPAFGLLGPRVQLLAHQLYIASRVGSRHSPRVLLADEVGLGKTIEAGLILHRQLLRGHVTRALVLVPDTLVHQWLVEMLRRFNLHFSVFDEERCEALQASGEDNPFETTQLVLCGWSLLADSEQRFQQCLAAGWDIVVVDEAHHLKWSCSAPSRMYEVAEALSKQSAGLLLLTATPEQLGIDGHFARLRLVDPDRYHDLARFRREESDYSLLAAAVDQLSANTHAADDESIRKFAAVFGDDVGQELRAALADEAGETQRDELIDRLLDRHGTGRVLYRNTRDTIGGFAQRQFVSHPLDVDLSPTETSIEDSRFKWLNQWLRDNRQSKALLITSKSSQAQTLERSLRERGEFRTGVFHEGMPLIARDRAAAYFADEEDGAQILICSEIGSEGRNFQFAHNLILFDLPKNPDLLEQRIGRLDRIGQRERVCIHVPYAAGTHEETLVRWYNEAIDAFALPCPGGERVVQIVGDLLEEALESPVPNSAQVEELIAVSRAATNKIRAELSAGRNRLLEYNSCHPRRATEIVADVANAAHNLELDAYMERVFDRFGVDRQTHTADTIILQPTEHMFADDFPGLPQDGITATFSRNRALAREDVAFLTWEHPMVTGVMDLIVNGEFGNTSLGTIKVPGLEPGTLIVETFHLFHCVAPASLAIERFSPQPSHRVVIDDKGRNLTEVLTPDHVKTLIKRVPRRTAEELVRRARREIRNLAANTARVADGLRDDLLASALESLSTQRRTEQDRLEALSVVNPNLRESELRFHREMTDTMRQHLMTASLKLDALRVIVCV